MSDQDLKGNSRRQALTKLGLATGVAVAGSLLPKLGRADVVAVSNHAPHAAMIHELGLAQQHVGLLQGNAKKLLKHDLVQMWGKEMGENVVLSPTAKALSSVEVTSVRRAFYEHCKLEGPGQMTMAWSISCCSCTPCCCAAATTSPQRSGAVA